MSMFRKSLKAEYFGTLNGEGRSKVWETELDIEELGTGFLVRVHGTEQGPTEAQVAAFKELISQARAIKVSSAKPVVDFLKSCEIIPNGVDLTSDNLWEHLTPSFSEVGSNNEYAAGSGPEGSVAITVGYEIPWEGEHLLQLAIIDGTFHRVYSE